MSPPAYYFADAQHDSAIRYFSLAADAFATLLPPLDTFTPPLISHFAMPLIRCR